MSNDKICPTHSLHCWRFYLKGLKKARLVYILKNLTIGLSEREYSDDEIKGY
jgi:hypothetical protein